MSHVLPDEQLAKKISNAAFDPAKWIEVCDGMAQLIGGCGAVIFPTGRDQGRLALPHSTSIEDSFARYEDGEWYKRDLRYAGLPTMRQRGYMTDADCISYDDIKSSDYYQDFLRPVKLKWFAGIGFETEQNWWVLSIQRTLGREPFSKNEIRAALEYRSLLNSSATIARHLGFARIQGASSVLEQHGLSVIALGADQRVVHVSPSAERHLLDGLKIVEGKLCARHATDQTGLGRLIGGICRKIISSSSLHVALRRPEGKPPLVLYGCSLPELGCDLFQPAVALLVISDPNHQNGITSDLLIDYFGMTRAEARLAISLYLGATVEKHAAQHGVSPITIRNHLQELLRKTATHRQVDLIAALNRVIPRKQ